MVMSATPATVGKRVQSQISVDAAMRIAWWTWFTFLAIPFLLFLLVVWKLMDNVSATANRPLATTWFIISMTYLAIGGPAAFFWRSHLFREYWNGRLIEPRAYLIGMITVWSALEIGGLLALIGCLASGSLVPNLLPALVAFMLFTPLWPSGLSMTRRLTDEHDPADYVEPR